MGGKQNKRIARIKTAPSDYTYLEAKALMKQLGYQEYNGGKSSGSSIAFFRGDESAFYLHKPHPEKEMDKGAVKALREFLIEKGDI